MPHAVRGVTRCRATSPPRVPCRRWATGLRPGRMPRRVWGGPGSGAASAGVPRSGGGSRRAQRIRALRGADRATRFAVSGTPWSSCSAIRFGRSTSARRKRPGFSDCAERSSPSAAVCGQPGTGGVARPRPRRASPRAGARRERSPPSHACTSPSAPSGWRRDGVRGAVDAVRSSSGVRVSVFSWARDTVVSVARAPAATTTSGTEVVPSAIAAVRSASVRYVVTSMPWPPSAMRRCGSRVPGAVPVPVPVSVLVSSRPSTAHEAASARAARVGSGTAGAVQSTWKRCVTRVRRAARLWCTSTVRETSEPIRATGAPESSASSTETVSPALPERDR